MFDEGRRTLNSDSSLLKVGLSGFRSDEDRRDRWVRSSLFNTRPIPQRRAGGHRIRWDLPWPLPESGEATFKLERRSHYPGGHQDPFRGT